MAKPFQHRDKWRIRVVDAFGRRLDRTFATREECLLFEADIKRERQRARLGFEPVKQVDRTYEQLCDRWREFVMSRKRSAKDDESIMRCHLIPTFCGQSIHTISADQIDRLRQRLERERKPKTVRNILTLLRSQLNYAHDLEWITKVPKFRMPKVKLIEEDFRYLKTDGEIRRFLRTARAESEGAYVLYATAIDTGMRKGGLAALTWSQIDFGTRLIFVDRSHDRPCTKGGFGGGSAGSWRGPGGGGGYSGGKGGAQESYSGQIYALKGGSGSSYSITEWDTCTSKANVGHGFLTLELLETD